MGEGPGRPDDQKMGLGSPQPVPGLQLGLTQSLALTLPFRPGWFCPASGPRTRRAGFQLRLRCGGVIWGNLLHLSGLSSLSSPVNYRRRPGSEIIGHDFKPLATSKFVLCLRVCEELMRNCYEHPVLSLLVELLFPKLTRYLPVSVSQIQTLDSDFPGQH